MTDNPLAKPERKSPGKPFVKGDKRIWKKGRGKGSVSIPDILRRICEHETPDALTERIRKAFRLRGKINIAEAIHWGVIIEALKGESWAVQYIADRTEGKPCQMIRTEGAHVVFEVNGLNVPNFSDVEYTDEPDDDPS
jgi:hypothetical protein